MRFGLTKQQIIHILKVAGWVTASTVVGLLISIITEQPDIFGVVTPIVNVLLVTVQQMLKKPEEE